MPPPDAAYSWLVLRHPWFAIAIACLIVGLAAGGVPKFRIDASGDSLLLESDVALGYYRQIREKYGSDDFLVLTWSPRGDLFSAAALEDLKRMRDELASIKNVRRVTSILDVPLFESPPVTPAEISRGEAQLLDPRTDIELARNEFHESPLYSSRILSKDGQATAMQLDLESSERRETALLIDDVRAVIARHRDKAEIHLGGLPMIRTDMLSYVRHDLLAFGSSLVAVLLVVLGMLFRQLRWVALPLLVSGATILSVIGLLGYLHWPVTVVSSNFVSLLLILTLSLNVHLAVRYRELATANPDASGSDLAANTVRSKFLPALLTATTTMIAFGSLTVAGIRPVIDFGWMMVIGIAIGFLLTFLLLPAILVLLGRGGPPAASTWTDGVTQALRIPVQRWPVATSLMFLPFALASAWGLSRLSVDNRFIDYFDESTAIHEGMSYIDRQLGGTTPLDVVIDGPPEMPVVNGADPLPLPGEAGFAAESYWLRDRNIATAEEIHRFLAGREEIGSVQSLRTTMYVFRQLADTDEPDSLTMSLIYKRMPDSVKERIVSPFLSADGDQLRFAARVYETRRDLDRDALLQQIRNHLVDTTGIEPDRVHMTGVFVLYNNVLKSLLGSQVSTIAVVCALVLLTFAIAFRSLKVAAIAIVPNLLGAAIVLSVLGFSKIPLDIMTITIAAIAIGIGVDDTVHYVHRFRREYLSTGDYDTALRASHDSVGKAMLYTTLTIVLGFSVLVFSNFVPTVYFGLLTALAMTIALVADLTLLPVLLIRVRAFDNSRRGDL